MQTRVNIYNYKCINIDWSICMKKDKQHIGQKKKDRQHIGQKKKDRQHIGQKKKDDNLQSITYETKN